MGYSRLIRKADMTGKIHTVSNLYCRVGRVSKLFTVADVLSFKSSQDEGVVSSSNGNNLDSRLRNDVESPKEL